MLVSFYAQAAIIILSFLVTLLPFLGFPQTWSDALVAVLGTLILGIASYSLYKGYTRALARMERRTGQKKSVKREDVVSKKDKETRESSRITVESKEGDGVEQ